MKSMVKLVILFRTGRHSVEFYNQYNAFLMKLEELPGLRRKAVSNVFGAMSGLVPYSHIVEAIFDSREALREALTSPVGVEAGQLLLRFAGPDAIALYMDTLEAAFGEEPPASAT